LEDRTSQIGIYGDYNDDKHLEPPNRFTNSYSVSPTADDDVAQVGAGSPEDSDVSDLEAWDTMDTMSTGDESISLRSTIDPSSTLSDLIREKSKKAASAEGRIFYPINDLEKVVTRIRVRQEISNVRDLDEILDKIFVPRTVFDHKTRVFKIFVILTLIGKPEAIQDFINGELYDLDLPFERIISKGTPKTRDQYLRNPQIPRRSHIEIGLFERWAPRDIESFMEKQHAVCVPIFDFDTQPGAPVSYYNLHEQTILPYIENEENVFRSEERSDVWRVKIHPAHIICKGLGVSGTR
jgi:hypothetical protein